MHAKNDTLNNGHGLQHPLENLSASERESGVALVSSMATFITAFRASSDRKLAR